MTRRLPVLSAAAVTILALGATAASGAAGDKATGSGHVTVNDERRTFALSARELPDGTFSGHAVLHTRSSDSRVKIDIACLRVVGNVATMSGTITQSSNPRQGAEVGDTAIFTVEDNGEGAGAPPDRISLIPRLPFRPDPATACENQFPLTHQVEAGNVQVG